MLIQNRAIGRSENLGGGEEDINEVGIICLTDRIYQSLRGGGEPPPLVSDGNTKENQRGSDNRGQPKQTFSGVPEWLYA